MAFFFKPGVLCGFHIGYTPTLEKYVYQASVSWWKSWHFGVSRKTSRKNARKSLEDQSPELWQEVYHFWHKEPLKVEHELAEFKNKSRDPVPILF